jgi:hypothetical protein
MPLVAQIVCDSCHAVKKATNHWYVISLENNSFCLKPLAFAFAADWATKHCSDSSLQYFCGRFCAVDALTGWMTKLYQDETGLSPTHGEDTQLGAHSRKEIPMRDHYLREQYNRSTLQDFPHRAHVETKTVSN